VLEAENGVRAVSLLNKEEIHLALLDIMMPGKNGYEVLAHLRRQSNIPVVFLSAKGADEDKNMELDIKIPDEPIPLKPKSSFSCVNRKYSFDRCL
ncbi:MAG: response regulator, partial [Clostridiales bacterium]|nr:response regulator [Clostridiales bacterium]